MALNFQQWMAQQNQPQGGGDQGGQPGFGNFQSQPAWMGGLQNYYNQIAQANQQMQRDQDASWVNNREDRMQDESGRNWRKLNNPVEQFFAGANDVTNALSSYSGWNPEAGFTPENVFRFGIGLPGMMLSSIPDALSTGYEIATGTPIKESTEGWVPDEKLSSSQVAADVGYLALDAAGFIPGLGIESKAAGTIAKGIGKAGGISSKAIRQVADTSASGMTKSAGILEKAAEASGWTGNKLKAAKFGDTAAEVAASTVFEGAQEAGQTGFEDIRYKQFGDDTMDRMIEAGTWGAIGGFGASGTMAGANYGINKIRGGDDSALTAQQDQPRSYQPTTAEQWSLTGDKPSGYIAQSLQQHYLDQARSDRRLDSPGAVMAENVSADPSLRVDQAMTGAEDFVQAFYLNDKSAKAVSNAICDVRGGKTDQDTALSETRNAIEARTVNINGADQTFRTQAEALNALKQKYWGDVRGPRIAWEKSPATKNRGGYLDLVGFHDGKGLIVHPYVAPMTGMDFDGDQSAIHFSTFDDSGNNTLNLIGYASEIMRSREGNPQSDVWYTDFRPGRFSKGGLKARLDDVFAPYKNGSALASNFAEELDKAVNSGKSANYEVVRVLDEISSRIDELNSDASNLVDANMLNRLPGARRVVGDIMSYADKNPLASVDQRTKEIYAPFFADLAADVIESDTTLSDEVKAKIFEDASSPLYAKGRLGQNGRVGAHYEDLGLAYYSFVTEANQPFRQHAQLNLNFGKRQGAFTQLSDSINKFNLDQDVLDVLVRTSFRIARATTTPLSAIEGMLDSHTLDTAYHNAGLDRSKIKSAKDFESMQEELRKAYNADSEVYEEVKKTEQVGGYVTDITAVPRPPIAENDTAGIDRVTLRIYGNTLIEDIFDESYLPKEFIGHSLGEVVSYYGKNPAIFQQVLTESGDVKLEGYFSRLVEAYGSEKHLSSKAIENDIRKLDFHDVKSRMVDGKFSPRDYGALNNLVNMIVEFISPNAAEALGLNDSIYFMENTVFGDMLINGNEDARVNAFYCLLVKGQFIDIERVLRNDLNLSGDDLKQATEWALSELERFRQQEPLKALIAREMLASENHTSVILDGLTSVNISFQDKVNEINRLYKDLYPDLDILSDFMIDGSDDFSVSSISRRRARGEQAITQYENALYTQSMQAIDDLRKSVDTGAIDANVALGAITSAVNSASMDINVDPYILSIMDSLGTGLAWNEKGVNPKSFASAAEAQIININGGPLSYIEQLTSFSSGAMSVNDFASNRKMLLSLFSDRKKQVRVFSTNGSTRNSAILTGDKIFAAVSPTYNPEVGPTFHDWMELFDRCPQIEGLICSNITQPVMVFGEGGSTIAKVTDINQMVHEYSDIMQAASVNDEDTRVIAQCDYGIQQIGARLLNDMRYTSMIIHCMEDMGIPENATMESIKSQFLKLHNQFSTAFFFHGQWRSTDNAGKLVSNEYSTMRDSYVGELSVSAIDDISDSIDDIIGMIDEDQIRYEAVNRTFQVNQMKMNQQDAKDGVLQAAGNAIGLDAPEPGVADTGMVDSSFLELKKMKQRARWQLVQMRQIANEFATDTYIDPITGDLIAREVSNTVGVSDGNWDSYTEDAIKHYESRSKEVNGRSLTDDEISKIRGAAQNYKSRFGRRGIDFDALEDSDKTEYAFVRRADLPAQRMQADNAVSSLLDTIDAIRHEIGDSTAFSDIDEDAINALYSEDTGFLIVPKWDAMRARIDGAIIEHSIAQLNMEWSADLNKNAFMAQHNFVQAFDDLSADVDQWLSDMPNPLNKETGMKFRRNLDLVSDAWQKHYHSQSFPVPNFSSSMNMKAATDMRLGLSGGLVPGSITRNGGALKQCAGFGYLSPDLDGFIEPRNMTLGELRDIYSSENGDEVARWNYVKTGDWSAERGTRGKDWDTGTLGSILMDNDYADDMVVQVLHPDDNPNGIWFTNTPAPLSEKYRPALRFSNILGVILDTSQEAMVLKLKKKFEAKIKMVDEYRYNSHPGYSLDLTETSRTGNAESMRLKLKNMLTNYRNGYMQEFIRAFNDDSELASLNFGIEQARILSQGLTPGVIVSVNGKDSVISAEHLWNPESFERRLHEIAGDPNSLPEISVCQVLSISPTEGSARINKAIDAYNVELSQAESKPVKSETQNRAYDAMRNWDDYLDDELSIDEVLSYIDAPGRAYHGGLSTEESLTYVQRYLGLVHNAQTGATVGYRGRNTKPITKQGTPDMYAASKSATEDLFGDGSSYQVVNMFFDSSQAAIFGLEQSRYVSTLHNAGDYHWPDFKKISCGIVMDQSQLQDAIKWARDTGNMLLLDPDVKRRLNVNERALYRLRANPVRSNRGDLYLINPAAYDYDKALSRDERSSGNLVLEPTDIKSTYIDGVVANLYNMGDADIWADPSMYYGLRKVGMSKFTINGISGARGRAEILTVEEARAARDLLFKENGEPKDKSEWNKAGYNFDAKAYEGLSFDKIAYKVRDYLDSRISGDSIDDDGVKRINAGREQVIALYKVTNLDGSSVYAPLISPKNSPMNYDQCYLSTDRSGNIYLGYTSDLQVSGQPGKTWFFKMSFENEAFKGIASPIPEGNELPTFGFDDQRESINMAATNDTEKSRVPGRALQLFKGSLWYFAKRQNMSYLRNQDGTPKKPIVDAFTMTDADGNAVIDQGPLNDFLAGDPKQWKRVANGDIKLLGDGEDVREQNEVIQKVVKTALGRVPIVELFSNITSSGVNSKTDVRYFMALNNLDLNQTLLFFNGMDSSLCPKGCWDDTNPTSFWFNRDGLFRCSYNRKQAFLPVRWAPHNPIADFSEIEGPGGEASESNQALVRLGLEQGFIDSDLQTIMDFSSYLAGNPSFYHQRLLDRLQDRRVNEKVRASQESTRLADVLSYKYGTPKEIAQLADVLSVGEAFKPSNRRTVYDGNDEVPNWWTDQRIVEAIYKLNQAIGYPLTQRTIEVLTINDLGHTYNDGKGANSIDIQTLADSIMRISKSIREEGLPILSNKTVRGDRVSQPLVNPQIAKLLWEKDGIKTHPKNLDENGLPSFDVFKERMFREQDRAQDIISELPPADIAKQRELFKAAEYHNLQWGRRFSQRLYENVYSVDMLRTGTWLTEGLRQASFGDDFDYDRFEELMDRSRTALTDRKKMIDGRNHAKTVKSTSSTGNKIVGYKNDRARIEDTVFRSATDLSRLLGVMDVWLPVSNIGYRAVNQTMMDWIMAAGRHGRGPFKVQQPVNQKILRTVAANDQMGFDIWMLMHDAALTSDEMEFMVSLEDDQSLRNWIDEKANESRFNKFKNAAFRFASGGNALMKGQLVNFVNRFACFANEDPVLKQYWLTPDAQGYTRLDRMLAEPSGCANFLKEVFGGRNGESASYQAAMNAMQSVRVADMAQDHILIEMFKNATNKHPLPEFLMTTLVSRFPRYGLNFTEEILNYLGPVSTIRYVFTDYIATRAHEKAAANSDYVDPHYEMLQRNTSLKEAFMVDMLHLGPHLVAMILAALPGAVEPPDDEKKWGNPQEWLICGMRVGEAWWMEDILGLAIPMMTYQKSVMLGRPRLDLLVNGVANVCYSNPMIKIADAVKFMMDPFDGLYADYEEMKSKYDDSRGGEIGFLDFIQDNAATFGVSWVTQFFTPTFVKSAWNYIMPYEYDYRHVYQENKRGVLTEEGESGDRLIETSYDDAMLRRLTRKNPVLALIVDLTHPGNTSYSPLGFPGKMAMPLTVYNDQHQYEYMKTWSIQGLSEADQQAKIMQILYKLEEYQDNLDALVATGFYLDSGTKAAVSSAIWDQYYSIDQQWNQMQQNGELDKYYLGNGDYDAGNREFARLLQLKNDTKRYYSDLYYKTMKSQQLSQPMITYNRYNTTYAQDDDGNWYATGFRPMGVLPFTSAPGTIDKPEGTAGYSGDFVTISAADGLPLENMRALTPTNAGEYEEWPDLKSWSADGEGEGYSAQYQKWNGTDSISATATTPKAGYPRSSGGSGGGGGGGGGGRGGSSAPNTYAPSVSLPRANAGRIMNTDRLVNPSYDYLRPDFETKGSREAYRRSDI